MPDEVRRRFAAVLLRRALGASGRTVVKISGRSMRPLLTDGDDVRVRRTSGALRPGMVVAVDQGLQLVVHVIVAVRDGRVITQGLGAARPDPAVEPERVLGEAVAFRAPGGAWWPLPWQLGLGFALLARARRRLGLTLRNLG